MTITVKLTPLLQALQPNDSTGRDFSPSVYLQLPCHPFPPKRCLRMVACSNFGTRVLLIGYSMPAWVILPCLLVCYLHQITFVSYRVTTTPMVGVILSRLKPDAAALGKDSRTICSSPVDQSDTLSTRSSYLFAKSTPSVANKNFKSEAVLVYCNHTRIYVRAQQLASHC